MKELALRELVKYKKLPFNIYNEKGHVLMYTGDILTPGKLMELREANILIYDENFEKKSLEARENPLIKRRKEEEKQAKAKEYYKKFFNEKSLQQNNDVDIPASIKARVNDYTQDNDLIINTKSLFSSDLQLELKEFHKDILDELEVKNYVIAQTKYIKLMKIIEHEILDKISHVKHVSQLKLLGDYKICHSLNVAIISAFIAQINPIVTVDLKDVILSGLMHDIGKTRIDEEIAYKKVLYAREHAEFEKHVIIGYKIVKEIFKLGNAIARPALEHHICADGSGFPRSLSIDNMTDISKIVALANFYDNLTFNRSNTEIERNYEAGKIILSVGAKKYPANLIYDLANKYILNDTTSLSEMIGEK